MKNFSFLLAIFLLCSTALAQQIFEIKRASKLYNVRLEVEKCDEISCEGEAKFSIFKKGQVRPLQVFSTQTEFMAEEAKLPNTKLLYDYQSVVFFEDYDFDNIEDLAIRDGNNGGYGGPSYQIYLFSPKTKKFVHSSALTRLNQAGYLGAMQVDKKKKVLRTFGKDGCCWHITEEYTFIKNRLVKVFSEEEDARLTAKKKVKITTKKLVNGKWQTKIKYVKRQE